RVHALPSSHAAPSGPGGFEHAPVAGSHMPATWHASCAMHATGAPAGQTPPWHVSAWVHGLPSSHALPSGFAGFEHAPVAGSQTPGEWHGSWAVQTMPLVPMHAPARQMSVRVQRLPSSHAVPSGAGGFEHTPVAGSHTPATWQGSRAVQA